MASRRRKKKPPLENAEDSYCRKTYRTVGCSVVTFSQPRRTKQTPGIADLLVFDARSGTFWWHEVKRQQGEEWLKVGHGQTPEQEVFQKLVEAFGMTYILGSREAMFERLKKIGVLT